MIIKITVKANEKYLPHDMAYIRMLRYAKEEVVSQPTITG